LLAPINPLFNNFQLPEHPLTSNNITKILLPKGRVAIYKPPQGADIVERSREFNIPPDLTVPILNIKTVISLYVRPLDKIVA
jgi:hypothetical protein